MVIHLCYETASSLHFSFFFFNDTATTEIYTLSLHDALPISMKHQLRVTFTEGEERVAEDAATLEFRCERFSDVLSRLELDRKSTRLNSSHLVISYAVFCLKKKRLLDPGELLAQLLALSFLHV